MSDQRGLPPYALHESVDGEAEGAILSVLEKRRRGELPPSGKREAESRRDVLPAVPPAASDVFGGTVGDGGRGLGPPQRRLALASAARRVMNISRVKRFEAVEDVEGPTSTARDSYPEQDSPFHDMMAGASGTHQRTGSSADRLFGDLEKVEENFRVSQLPTTPEDGLFGSPYASIRKSSSYRSTRSGATSPGYEGPTKDVDEEVGEHNEASELLPKTPGRRTGLRGVFVQKSTAFSDVLSPGVLFKNVLHFMRTTFLFGIVPCLATAYLLFQNGNPELQFLPQQASLSWWLIFTVRQLVTLQLAICTQYLLVDAFAIRSPGATRIMGPLFCLYAMQAKGWPFIISAWGGWDLLLLHGTYAFSRNWLFFLEFEMLSDANPHDNILDSDIYLRVLLSMVIAGVSVGIKRTYLALYIGRRTFAHYKPLLGPIMENILLVTEVADLANLTETKDFALQLASEIGKENERATMMSKHQKGSKKWGTIQFKADQLDSSDSESDDSSIESINEVPPAPATPLLYPSPQENQHKKADSTRSRDKIAPAYSLLSESSAPMSKINRSSLDRWEEPENKQEKDMTASIHDILQFRKALSYMDDSHPFSVSFGPSDTRDRCIKSANLVYKRLLKFAPDSSILPFEVISALAYDDDGNLIDEKMQALVRLFRPDRRDEITMLAFVQSSDWVYKKLRFFRASVANSSLIDQVLEKIFNFFFYVILTLVIVSGVMDCDPWSLLLSVSTLLVSFSFAVGTSISKLIEGILLIAVRRPYDLGDRITLSTSDAANSPDGSLSWFVEDVNLYTTTLRFAGTNEVSTVNNGAIANSRIVNFSRSIKALVTLDFLFAIATTHEKVELFKKAVDAYIKDNPSVWSSIVHFRTTQIDPDMEYAGYSLRLQHMKSWQDMAQVMNAKGELLQFCIKSMEQLGIVYDSPDRTMNVRMKNLALGDSETGTGIGGKAV